MKAVMQSLFILLLTSLFLAGCGQKGDLFLPATPPPVATPAEPAAAPATKQPEQTQPEPLQQQQPAPVGTALPDATQQAQPSTSNTKR